MSAYQYCPLESPEHIRLIYLNPSSEDEPIACEIHHVSLIDRPIYEALSYTWNTNESTGEPPQNHTIACGQFQLSVTPNLFSALQHLRKAPRDLALWVDAICINQADNFERCQQVRIMHRIYATASSVLVWFGEPEPEDIIAFDFIQKDCSFRSTLPCEAQDLSADIHGAIETGLLPPLDGAPWKALGSLLNKGWFYRVWVLQEVVAATAVSFHCSIHQVDLVAMLSLADFLAEPAVMVGPSLVATRQGLHMLNTIRSIKRLVKESRRFTNMDVFKITRLFDASDARDKSYGLMGIVQDKDIIRTNYDSPSAELFTEATIHSLVNERSFSCLSFADPSFSTEDDGLPSWVPNWSSLSSSRRPFAQEESNTWFNMATGGPKLHRTPTVCNRILTVEGSEIDVIEILGRPHKVPVATDIEGSSMRDVMIWRLRETVAWIKECEDVTKPGPPHAHSTDLADEAFWHTITLVFKKLGTFSASSAEPNIGFEQDLNIKAQEEYRFEQAIVLWSPRRLFGKAKKGYLGMFPEGLVKGDIVCAIIGAPAPFVIRPQERDTYRFVGEAYVHGFMNGEIFDFLNFEEILKDISLQ